MNADAVAANKIFVNNKLNGCVFVVHNTEGRNRAFGKSEVLLQPLRRAEAAASYVQLSLNIRQ